MKIRFLVALLATIVACSEGGDGPTNPGTNPGNGGEPITPPPPPPPPPARAVVFKVWNVLSSGTTIYAPDTTMVTIQSGSFKDSVLVRGQASMTFPTTTPDTVKITLPGNSQYPMVVATVPKAVFDSWKDTVPIDRFPRKWVVHRGLYAGTNAVIDLVRPYKRTPAPDNQSFYRRAGNDTIGYWYPQLGWNPSSFPVKIWIDPDSSFKLSGVTPDTVDSASLAAGIADLSNLLGWTPFIMSSKANGGSIRAVLWKVSSAQVSMFDNPQYELIGGIYFTTLFSRFKNPSEVKHEGIHMLEFGHTCEWVSLMPTGCVGRPNTVDETYLDVAYIEAWYAYNETRRQTGARIHMGENLNGTLVELGIPIDQVVYK